MTDTLAFMYYGHSGHACREYVELRLTHHMYSVGNTRCVGFGMFCRRLEYADVYSQEIITLGPVFVTCVSDFFHTTICDIPDLYAKDNILKYDNFCDTIACVKPMVIVSYGAILLR